MKENIFTEINEELKKKILNRTPQTGRLDTAIDGLVVVRRVIENELVELFDTPLIGITVQGAKHSVIGNESYQYGPGHCLITGIDIPTSSRILSSSPERPFLAVGLALDRELISQLATEILPSQEVDIHHTPVAVAEVDIKVLAAFLRLMNLLDDPEDIPVMAPLLKREIHHRLLLGPQGEWLRAVSTKGTRMNQIAQAMTWLKKNFNEPLQVEALAKTLNMSTSSFHRHFKEVAGNSPLQFQKQIRLREAKRLMVTDGHSVSSAAFAVGYESSTQFIREYKREFGSPPGQHIARISPPVSIA